MIKKITAKDIQKEKILSALTNAKDISEASEIAGVSRKTIYNYMSDIDFIKEYRDIKRQQLRDISNKMTAGANKSFDMLLRFLDDDSLPIQVRFSTACKIIEYYSKFLELEAHINEDTIAEYNPLDSLLKY
jgi:hypothetical protein